VALRYFNVYGPRQSLDNPYTGVAAIFISRLKNDHQPLIFEDGQQTRDFVSVHDIVRANLEAMQDTRADYQVFNVGSGQRTSVVQLADLLGNLLGKDPCPEIVGKYRKGDVRHCFADISKIEATLGWRPSVSLDEGLRELVTWSRGVSAADRVDAATSELSDRGLLLS
jgi:dTDP-L-rhamnose 4-epimerase